MSKKISRLSILVVFVIIMISISVLWKQLTAPSQFVTNQTFVKSSDLLFDYEMIKYPSNVEIILPEYEEKRLTIGFVTDPWNLNFGIIPNGGSYGTRHLNISNFQERKIKVVIDAYGSVKPLISFSKSNFVLQPSESAYIDVFLNTTNATIPGNYTGEIDITVMKPKYEFLYPLMW